FVGNLGKGVGKVNGRRHGEGLGLRPAGRTFGRPNPVGDNRANQNPHRQSCGNDQSGQGPSITSDHLKFSLRIQNPTMPYQPRVYTTDWISPRFAPVWFRKQVAPGGMRKGANKAFHNGVDNVRVERSGHERRKAASIPNAPTTLREEWRMLTSFLIIDIMAWKLILANYPAHGVPEFCSFCG